MPLNRRYDFLPGDNEPHLQLRSHSFIFETAWPEGKKKVFFESISKISFRAKTSSLHSSDPWNVRLDTDPMNFPKLVNGTWLGCLKAKGSDDGGTLYEEWDNRESLDQLLQGIKRHHLGIVLPYGCQCLMLIIDQQSIAWSDFGGCQLIGFNNLPTIG